MTALVSIQDLRVTARGADGTETEIVKGVSLEVARGEVLGLIGESGSGKTTIALATMGYARYGCRISGGTIRVGEAEITSLGEKALRAIRGRRIAYIAQSAAASFNPSRTIMAQVIESALIHGTASEAEARAKAVDLFRALAIPAPDTIGNRYPHQVSGGQLQRLMAAMALITDPDVVIFDEPTTALDVTTQIEVLKAFKAAIRDRATTGIYVTHDLAVIAQIADRIVVLRNGEVRETGPIDALLTQPKNDYTRSLLAAAEPAPRLRDEDAKAKEPPLLAVTGLTAGYGGLTETGEPRIPILRDVALTIARGASLGIIGESGCGKSTLARVIAGLAPQTRGTVALAGENLPPALAQRSKDQLRRIQLVFQSADTALNPTMSIEEIIGRPLTFYFGLRGEERRAQVRRMLDLTHLPADVLGRLPGDLSGGQKQRVNLARALAARPDVLLCDEVTSALDTVVAAAILDLIVELRRELGLTTMFISHDLKTVRAICDDVLVLYAGRQVETMAASGIAGTDHHPYTRLLLASVPALRRGWLEEEALAAREGKVDLSLAEGCVFHPRCPDRIAGTCEIGQPPIRTTAAGGAIACHLPAG
ncbi:MAG: ABC transporter ATP-binding protein [Phreatobacter sp.]|nr:ABC transporter ATP-binding protein [Phreatobacter sp.]